MPSSRTAHKCTVDAIRVSCLVPNLWDYSRWPRGLYPVTGLPYQSGISTCWNMRPCQAALGARSCWRLQGFLRSRGRAPTTVIFSLSVMPPGHGGLSENQRTEDRPPLSSPRSLPPTRHPRSLLIGDLSPNTQALHTQGKDARLLPRA